MDAMQLTPEQVMLVQSTWEELAPAADRVGEELYQRLFAAAPEVKHLFHGDARSQGRSLAAMLGAAVTMLLRPESIAPTLEDLGMRHQQLGVDAKYFPVFREAMLGALGSALGPVFSGSVREAWSALFDYLAGEMQARMQGRHSA
jgi:hemoglobin-like flavoprotein